MRLKCYNCNKAFPDVNMRFCPYCGSMLAIDSEFEAEEKKKKAEEERRFKP